MRKYKVRLADTFLWDMIDITLHILEESGRVDVSKRFYNDVLSAIDNRSFGADSYEPFHPYPESPEYRRLYFGHYIIFYIVEEDYMDVHRILWSGADSLNRL